MFYFWMNTFEKKIIRRMNIINMSSELYYSGLYYTTITFNVGIVGPKIKRNVFFKFIFRYKMYIGNILLYSCMCVPQSDFLSIWSIIM